MKRPYIILLLFVLIATFQCVALDHIILRDGQAFDVKLHQITDEIVSYSLKGDKDTERESLPSKDVYMVYIEKQGNVYLTPDGKRITGESNRVDRKKYDAIYLVSGKEIGAKNIKVTEDDIVYTPVKKGGLLSGGGLLSNIIGNSNNEGLRSFPKEEVFLIRYKSGMTDVITPIDKVEKPDTQIKEEAPEATHHVVIYHNVTKGQSLKTISELYNATVTQIIEWNDLPAKSKPTAPLTPGKQLKLFLPK